MIKFFRTFRRNYLAESRFGRYLLYAIGEIFLVVVGILIALQINESNELRKRKNTTQTYVENLKGDLAADTLMYTEYIQFTQQKHDLAIAINAYVFERQPIADTASFIVNLQAVGRLYLPSTSDNTYQDLVSTGNLKLIKDDSVIDAIRAYYTDELSWWYAEYIDQLVNGYLPIVVHAMPMSIHQEILDNERNQVLRDTIDRSILKTNIQSYNRKEVAQIIEALASDTAFAFQLKKITRSHLVHRNVLIGNKVNAISLFEKLETLERNEN